jgi:hypothetical protein
MTPEERARQTIDQLLTTAGGAAPEFSAAELGAVRGVALRETELSTGYGIAGYLDPVDGESERRIEAKKMDTALTALCKPLHFIYKSAGAEPQLKNPFDPEPSASTVCAFQNPDTPAKWLKKPPQATVPQNLRRNGGESEGTPGDRDQFGRPAKRRTRYQVNGSLCRRGLHVSVRRRNGRLALHQSGAGHGEGEAQANRCAH